MSYPVLKLKLKIVAGRKLVAKDRGMLGFGKAKSSDPYVRLSTVHKTSLTDCGKTEVVSKNLNPTWDQTLRVILKARDVDRVSLLFSVYDHDVIGKDDPMGVVQLTIPTVADSEPKWLQVESGENHSFLKSQDVCPNATGELQIQVLSVHEVIYTPPKPDFVPTGPGCLETAQTYLMAEKLFSWSGNTYHVKDAKTQKPAFTIKGRAMSARDKMEITNAVTGAPICILNKKLYSMVSTYTIWTYQPNFPGQQPEGESNTYRFAEMEREVMSMNPTLHCQVRRKKDGRLVSSAICQEDVFQRGTNITITGTPLDIGVLAKCDQTSLYQSSAGNTFCVQVVAGACPVLCLCMAVAMDNMLDEQRRRRRK